MTLLDHTTIASRYFFPRADPPRSGDRWVVGVDGASLVGARVGRGDPKSRALLHFHGNGEVVADWVDGDFSHVLDAAGFDVFFAEYRGYGASTGRPALATMLEDALAQFDALERAAEDVVVYGRSVGSLFALEVASHRGVRALVLESGIADVYERLALRVRAAELDVTDDVFRAAIAQKFDHESKMRAVKCPVRVLHTRHDGMVDVSHAERLSKWAAPNGELVVYEDGDHNSIHAFNGADIARRVLRLLAS